MEQKSFNEKVKNLLDQGITASKELAVKAEAKTRELGEQGVLLLEIKQLEKRLEKLKFRLGDEIYQAFIKRNESSIYMDTPPVAVILTELDEIRVLIERKRTELKDKQN